MSNQNKTPENTLSEHRRSLQAGSSVPDQKQDSQHDSKIYLKYILISTAIFSIAVSIQFGFILNAFKPQYLIVPIFLSIGLGFLLGRIAILKERLAAKTKLFRAVADFAQEFTYFRSIDGQYEYVSPSCKNITGYTTDDFYNTPNLMTTLIHPEDQDRWHKHTHNINDAGEAEVIDFRILHHDGRTVWVNHICGVVDDSSGKQIGVRSTNVDITERKAFEEHIERMAYYDPLTDLPNRHSLTKELKELIKQYHVEEKPFALLFLDLDRFKHINDSFGHELGDRLLVETAKRMKKCCRESTLITRFGGDEFVIVVSHIDGPQPALEYARQLLELLEQTITLDNKELYISGSIGIVLYPYDGQDAETLIRNADAAMFKAKQSIHGSIRLYSAELVDNAAAFISTENRIRQSLKKQDFIAHYQPKVDIETNKIIGAEALARWQTHDKGLVMPDEFIAIAEETGLIEKLGNQILEQSCQQLRLWQEQGYPISIAVNISGVQLASPDFDHTINKIIDDSGCDPAGLELEITEQVFISDYASAVKKLWGLKSRGISIAVDDFGTGYSSLSYLKKLPIDTLKIDRSFTHDICIDPRDVAILRAILLLCHDLHLNNVIEGIENQEQLDLAKALGCNIGQGFLFHKPMPADQLNKLLKQEYSNQIPKIIHRN